MSGLDDLRLEAVRALRFRGHAIPGLFDWQQTIGHLGSKSARKVWDFTCPHCLRSVRIDTRPPANGINIGGEAVALNCESKVA